jgi:hypothetical protein
MRLRMIGKLMIGLMKRWGYKTINSNGKLLENSKSVISTPTRYVLTNDDLHDHPQSDSCRETLQNITATIPEASHENSSKHVTATSASTLPAKAQVIS